MCGAELVSLVTAMAVALAQGRTVEEIGILSDVFTQLGDTLATYATQEVVSGCRPAPVSGRPEKKMCTNSKKGLDK